MWFARSLPTAALDLPLVEAILGGRMRLLALILSIASAIPSLASAQPIPRPSWLRLGPSLPSDPSVPLPAALRHIAEDVPNEGTPRPDEHYPVSNEHRHDLWFAHIRDLGGAFVGVGTDQCYTLAAVQNAQLVWIVDFDPLVPLVHRMYGVLVPASEDASALVARFSSAEEEATEALLRDGLAQDPERDAILGMFERNRGRMHGYLRRAQRNVVEGTGASWLSDPELYRRVRALFVGGRVIARNGDVTADGALRAVARAATRLGVPVRVVYFSNAEQFFRFGEGFRENLDALPGDARSIVLRTFRGDDAPYPRGDRWHYMVQPLEDMRARIRENGYRASRQFLMDVMSTRARLDASGLSIVDASVPRRYELADDEARDP